MKTQIEKVLNGFDISGNGQSRIIDIRGICNFAIHVVAASGSPQLGTLTVQLSCELPDVQNGVVVGATNFADFDTGIDLTNLANGPIVANYENIGAAWLRLDFEQASGTGTINVFYCGKGP